MSKRVGKLFSFIGEGIPPKKKAGSIRQSGGAWQWMDIKKKDLRDHIGRGVSVETTWKEKKIRPAPETSFWNGEPLGITTP